LAKIHPKLKLKVKNRLTSDGGNLSVELDFNHLDDFHPTQIVKRVDALSKLLETRQRLIDLLAKLDGNDVLTERLQKMLSDMESVQQVRKAIAARSEG
jgi:type VI secretion system protein ImpB